VIRLAVRGTVAPSEKTMPKGIYSQCLCVLTTREVPITEIGEALQAYDVLGYPDHSGEVRWQFGGPSLVASYRPDVNGKVVVDSVAHPWPDEMGNPQTDVATFGAWTMGQFGPGTYPGGLQRAGQHSWHWEPGRTIAGGHTGFVRLRSSYVIGAGGEAKCLPQDYDPVGELSFLTGMAQAILKMPGALCYFNPSGEVLRGSSALTELLDECRLADHVPLPAWCNVRFFNLEGGWLLMDTVGNGQLDVPDFEVLFMAQRYEPGRIDNYLRNVTLYLVGNPAMKLEDGERIDGPNDGNLTWRVRVPEQALAPPPHRGVARLYAAADSAGLRSLLGEKW
jgi:hypothetical protein